MNLKKYIGFIIVLLCLLGIANQQKGVVHNQEIVLQFNGTNTSEIDAEVAISILKKELENIGVTDFKVVENSSNTLKITYYSNADVSTTKNILLQKIRGDLGDSEDGDAPFQLPFNNHDKVAYSLDVHQIYDGNPTDSGLNGVVVLELKHKSDRLLIPNLSGLKSNENIKESAEVTVAFNLYKYECYALTNALQKIPEVRAGPLS